MAKKKTTQIFDVKVMGEARGKNIKLDINRSWSMRGYTCICHACSIRSVEVRQLFFNVAVGLDLGLLFSRSNATYMLNAINRPVAARCASRCNLRGIVIVSIDVDDNSGNMGQPCSFAAATAAAEGRPSLPGDGESSCTCKAAALRVSRWHCAFSLAIAGDV